MHRLLNILTLFFLLLPAVKAQNTIVYQNDTLIYTTNTRNGIILPDITTDFSIPENPNIEYNPETGELTVYTTDGQKVGTVKTEQNEGKEIFPLTIKDKDGNLYSLDTEKDKDGNPVTDENNKPKIPPTNLGKQGNPLPEKLDKTNISTDYGIITFEKGNGKYAFDNYLEYYKTVNIIESNRMYEHCNAAGTRYDVPWKLIPVGETDVVQAKIEIKQTDKNKFDPEKVVFSTPKGTQYKYTYNAKDKTYTLTIVAGQDNDVQEIYATYPIANGQICKTLGKLNVVSYKKQSPNLKLVFVNGYTVNTDRIKTELDKIYKPAGINWQVSSDNYTAPSLPNSFFNNESGLLENYNDAMDSLIKDYKSQAGRLDKDANYLFILNYNGTTTDRDKQAYMPRGRQFGFIFKGNIPANEI